MDYNLTLGKGKDAQQISSNDLKGGVKKEDIKDEKMRSIFEALDDGNGILEEKEVNQLKAKVQEAASKDGDATNLSNKEAKSLIKSLGLKGFKVEDVFRFLSTVKAAGVNIDYQTKDAENPDEIVIKYKPDAEGNSVIERHRSNDGGLIGSIVQDKNNNTMIKNADNRITGGKNDVGKYTRTYNEDGGYTDSYKDGRIRNFDRDGKWVSGTNRNGETYTKNYNEDGSYTEIYGNGEIQEYDKYGKQLSGKLANGKTWKNEYHDDGSYTRTYSNGEIREYDENGKLLSGEFDGKTWKIEYHDDDSFTRKYGDGETQEYDQNGKQLSGKLTNGTTYEVRYGEDGSLKYTEYTQKDGSKFYYGTDDKSFAQKTANGNFRVSPKQGETFDDTMERLGITAPDDQEMFKKANPKAYKRGYFLLTKPGNAEGDVYIPKVLADKLNVESMLVDETAEMEKHKNALKTPQMGI